MTENGKLVNVIRTELSELQHRLEHYIGDISGTDARSKRRRSILQSASELFVKQGYRSTSIDQVADAVGVAKGTIYLHFKTKVDLLLAAYAVEKLGFLANMESLFDESLAAEQRLKTWLSTALLLPRDSPLASKIMAQNEFSALVEAVPQELLDEVTQLQRRTLGHLVRVVSAHRGWTEGEVNDRLAVLSAVTLLSGMITDERIRRGIEIERFVEILTHILVDGLVGPVVLANKLPELLQRSVGAPA